MIKIIINIWVLLSLSLFASSLTQGDNQYKKGNYKLASELFAKGCKDKDEYSCIKLGLMYAKGEGVQLNIKKARNILRRACKKGHTSGCYELGMIYYQGLNGTKQNKKKAKLLFGTACNLGHERACEMYRRLNKY